MSNASLDRLLVQTCPWCGFPHLHHMPAQAEAQQLTRSPRCAPGRVYRVEVTSVVPTARAALTA